MPVTQREYDLMRLEAQLRIKKLVEEWQNSFHGARLQNIEDQLQQANERQLNEERPEGINY